MDRRRFIQTVGAASAAWPMLARAQAPSLRIGMANANMTVTYPYISSTLGLGLFKEEGVDVEVVHGQNSNQILGLLLEAGLAAATSTFPDTCSSRSASTRSSTGATPLRNFVTQE